MMGKSPKLKVGRVDKVVGRQRFSKSRVTKCDK